MQDGKPDLLVQKAFEAPVVEKATVPGLDDCVGSNITGQPVHVFSLPVGIMGRQKLYAYPCQPSFRVLLP